MATNILEYNGVDITRFAGGQQRGICYQITTRDGSFVQLTKDEAARVADCLRSELATAAD